MRGSGAARYGQLGVIDGTRADTQLLPRLVHAGGKLTGIEGARQDGTPRGYVNQLTRSRGSEGEQGSRAGEEGKARSDKERRRIVSAACGEVTRGPFEPTSQILIDAQMHMPSPQVA